MTKGIKLKWSMQRPKITRNEIKAGKGFRLIDDRWWYYAPSGRCIAFEKVCENCLEQFVTKKRRTKYCSVEYWGEVHRGQQHGSILKGSERGSIYTHAGYVCIFIGPEHPMYSMANKGTGAKREVKVHRLNYAEHIGRPLERWEQVHHIDGKRSNNEIGNLELRIGPHGSGATGPHCRTCRCFGDTPKH